MLHSKWIGISRKQMLRYMDLSLDPMVLVGKKGYRKHCHAMSMRQYRNIGVRGMNRSRLVVKVVK